MTALLVLGALLTLAQAIAGWVLWRRMREATHVINHNAREFNRALDCIAALEAQAHTFARHSDVQAVRDHADARAGWAAGAIADLGGDLAGLRADLEQHRRGSRHRRVRA